MKYCPPAKNEKSRVEIEENAKAGMQKAFPAADSDVPPQVSKAGKRKAIKKKVAGAFPAAGAETKGKKAPANPSKIAKVPNHKNGSKEAY